MPKNIVKVPETPVKENTSVREVIADDNAPQLTFEWNNREMLEYTRQGFSVPERLKGRQEERFLELVDPGKGPIEREVTKIVRVLAPDFTDPKKTKKDFIYYLENWYGKDWRGVPLFPVTDHQVGFYKSVEKTPIIGARGKITGHKSRDGPIIYYIPFTKDKVDEILENSTGTDKDTLSNTQGFIIKTNAFRSSVKSYDEFINYSFKELEAMAKQPPAQAPKK